MVKDRLYYYLQKKNINKKKKEKINQISVNILNWLFFYVSTMYIYVHEYQQIPQKNKVRNDDDDDDE